MREFLTSSSYFGLVITIFAFEIGLWVRRKLKHSVFNPMLIAIAVSSNLQGAATLVGDTTSILLAGHLELDFMDFFAYEGRPGMFWVVQENADVGRAEGPPDEEESQYPQPDQSRRLLPGLPEPLPPPEASIQPERKGGGQIENGDVRPHGMAAPDAGIGIIQRGDQGQPRRDADGPGRRQGAVPLLGGGQLDHGEQQRREKQQLHVLPGGFIDGAEGPHQQLLPAPFVAEMGQRSQHRHRQKAHQGPAVQPFAHMPLPAKAGPACRIQ